VWPAAVLKRRPHTLQTLAERLERLELRRTVTWSPACHRAVGDARRSGGTRPAQVRHGRAATGRAPSLLRCAPRRRHLPDERHQDETGPVASPARAGKRRRIGLLLCRAAWTARPGGAHLSVFPLAPASLPAECLTQQELILRLLTARHCGNVLRATARSEIRLLAQVLSPWLSVSAPSVLCRATVRTEPWHSCSSRSDRVHRPLS
jgi:hypothetical protein